MVARLDTIYNHNLHLLHTSTMVLVEVLTQPTNTRLTVLSVAIVTANKTPFVKSLANISQVMRFTHGQINNPAGFTVVPPSDSVGSARHRINKPVSFFHLLTGYTVSCVQYCAAWWRLTCTLVCPHPVPGPHTDLTHVFCLSGNYWESGEHLPALSAEVQDTHLLLEPQVDRWVLRMVGQYNRCCACSIFLFFLEFF